MATLALALGAAALSSGLGVTSVVVGGLITGIGTALGSYIDNAFILPALQPEQDIEGPRITELRLTFADEGSPHTYGLGEGVRTPCTIIWTSELQEVVIDEDAGGGKGGGKGGGSILSYEYYLDLALLYAVTKGQPTELLEIVANGKQFWREPVSVAVMGPGIDANVPAVISGQAIWDLVYTHPPGYTGTTFGDFVPGDDAVVSSFASPQNNGTFPVIAVSNNPAIGSDGTSRLRLFNPNGVAEVGPGAVQVSQAIPAFKDTVVDDVEVYPGDTTQSPDPTIESFEGVDNVPAWRGFAYAVLTRLFLNEFGTTAPVFNMIWRPGDGATAKGVMDRIFQLSEIDQDITVDTSAATNIACLGYSITGPADVVSILQPLMIAYDLIPQTTEDGLRFFPKREATIIDIDPSHLAAHESGEGSKERPLDVGDPTEVELPQRVTVKYVDVETNYQPGSQDERARVGGASKSTMVLNLPLVLDGAGSEARAIAKRVLYEAYVSRQPVKLSLPARYLHVQENDLIRIPDTLGQTWLLLVQKIDRGDNWVLQLECNVEILSVLLQSGVHEFPQGTIPDGQTSGGGALPFPDDNAGTPGPGPTPGGPPRIMIPCMLWNGEQRWKGIVGWVKKKEEPKTEYRDLGTVTAQAHGGYTLTPLDDEGANPYFLDDATFRVQMLEGELDSKTQQEVLNGGNIGLVYDPATGLGEVITWLTATPVGDPMGADFTHQYDLSGLYRGKGGTEVKAHPAGEQFLDLTGPGIISSIFDIPNTWLGETRTFLAIPPGEDPENDAFDSLARDFEITAGMIKPYTIADFVYNRDAAGNTGMIWQYRSMGYSKVFGTTGGPLTAPTELYEVDVFAKGGSEVLETFTVDNTSNILLTAAQITGFLGTATDAFDVRVYQVNTLLGGPAGGRGYDAGVFEVAAAGEAIFRTS